MVPLYLPCMTFSSGATFLYLGKAMVNPASLPAPWGVMCEQSQSKHEKAPLPFLTNLAASLGVKGH